MTESPLSRRELCVQFWKRELHVEEERHKREREETAQRHALQNQFLVCLESEFASDNKELQEREDRVAKREEETYEREQQLAKREQELQIRETKVAEEALVLQRIRDSIISSTTLLTGASSSTVEAPIPDGWSSLSRLKIARDSFSVTACGDSIVAFGGYCVSALLCGDTLIYDTNKDTWLAFTDKQGAPERTCHGSVCIGSCVYVYGGRGKDNASLKDLYCLDLSKTPLTWVAVPISNKANSKGSHKIVAVGNNLYLFPLGKTQDIPYLDVTSFNPAWTSLDLIEKSPDLSIASFCTIGSTIYTHASGSLWSLDVTSDSPKWLLVPGQNCPPLIQLHTLVANGKLLYLIGGRRDSITSGDILMLNLEEAEETRSWKMINVPKDFARHSHGACVTKKGIHILGGHNGTNYLSDHWLLQ